MSDNEPTPTEPTPVNLVELLGKPMSDFPDLPNLPGKKWFYGKLIDMVADHSRDKKTPFYQFSIRITDPGKDVTASEMAKVTDGGFSLADYEATANFYVTPKAMTMLRRFVTSLGFPESVSFIEALALDPTTGNPTAATKEKIQGRDVMFRTPAPFGEFNAVYLNNVEMLTGEVKT